MHKRTFKVLKRGDEVTNWDRGEWNGVRGIVSFTEPEVGMVGIKLDNGKRCVTPYAMVAMGDNSIQSE